MKNRYRILSAVVLWLAGPASLTAQDTIQVGVRTPLPPGEELPARVAQELVEFYNRPSTIRFSGRTRVPVDRAIGGDVAVLGGPLELAGRIDGSVVVLNGDITLREGSRIRGDLTVVGGVIAGVERGRVDGLITTYPTVFRYRRTDDGIEYLGSGPEGEPLPTGRRIVLPSWDLGESEVYVSARAYNRVEGLPLAVGPRITSGGSNPLRLEAFLIWRTEGGFDPDQEDIGWELRLKQWIGGHRNIWVEGAYWSVVDPIESWKLTNLENSLTFFFFRRDYRDYYERKGWYSRVGWRFSRLFGSFEFRDENHDIRSAGSPWTIFWNRDDDLPNAAADPGELRSLVLTLALDTRNDPDQPLSGWYNQLRVEQAVGGRLSGVKQEFTHLLLDLRRFNRVSRGSVLAFRGVLGGRLGGGRTPAQRQHVIGGPGSLPGYDMLEFDCRARSSGPFGSEPGYGCQRFALFQAEYRSGLNFRFHWDHREVPGDITGDIFSVQFNPAVVLFYNAGVAWDDEGWFDYLGDSDNWVADVGAGIDFGGLGLYLAYPLVGSGEFNFFARLTARL